MHVRCDKVRRPLAREVATKAHNESPVSYASEDMYGLCAQPPSAPLQSITLWRVLPVSTGGPSWFGNRYVHGLVITFRSDPGEDFGRSVRVKLPPTTPRRLLPGGRFRSYEGPSHAKQILQCVEANARHPDQYGWIVHVMVGQVINFRRCCDQSCSMIKIDANGQGPGFGGLVNGNTRQQLSASLQRWRAMYRRLLYIADFTC